MIYTKENMVDLVVQVDDILSSNIGELLSLLLIGENLSVKMDLKFGSVKNEKKYICKNAYAIKTIIGFSLYLDLYNEEKNEDFTLGFYKLIDIDFNSAYHGEHERIERVYLDCDGIEETHRLFIYK